MWATIIIAESFTRIMGSGNVYSRSDRRRRFLQYNFMDPGWGAEFPMGAGPPTPPPGPMTRIGRVRRNTRCGVRYTRSVDIAATETPILIVTTPENWWQLGAHPKRAVETLSFYSAFTGI